MDSPITQISGVATNDSIGFSNLNRDAAIELTKTFISNFSNYVNEVFEGTQIGAGAGGSGKIKFGPIEIGAGMEELIVYRVGENGVIQTTDSFSGVKIRFGDFIFKADFETGEVSLSAVSNDVRLDQEFVLKVGGTVPSPLTGQAVNMELHIDLVELVDINDLFEGDNQ